MTNGTMLRWHSVGTDQLKQSWGWFLALGILLVVAAVALALGVKLPLITSYRTAIILLLVAGLVICPMGGIGRVAAAYAWAHPVSILGYLLAAVILVVGGAYLLGKPLPLLSGDRDIRAWK